MYFMLDASKTNKIVGNAAKIPFRKLLNVFFKFFIIINPDINPPIKKITIKKTIV